MPPANSAQAGFIYSGPLGGLTVPQLAYWLPPGQPTLSSDGNNGGYAGAWDYASAGELNLITGSTKMPTHLPVWSTDTSLGTSSLKDSNNTVSTTEPVNFTGGMNVTGTTTINTTGTATTSIGNIGNDVYIDGSTVDIEDATTGSLILNGSATGKVTLGNVSSPIFLPKGEYNNGTFDDTGTVNIHASASGGSLDHNTYFLNFIDGNGDSRGGVQGQSNVDLLLDAKYDVAIAECLKDIILTVYYYVGGAADLVAAADIFEAPVAVIEAVIKGAQIPLNVISGIAYAAEVAYLSIEAGVQYSSSDGDYAEYLQRSNPSELLSAGDVVGVKNGLISKNTEGAQSIYSISAAPIILGNVPPKGEESKYNEVGFLGQVPVKVHGVVHSGNFIVTSGLNDGFGVAIPEDKMTPQQFTQVIGRAWTSSDADDMGIVTVAVGLSAKDMSDIVSRQETEITTMKTNYDSQIASMNTRFQALEGAMTESDPAKKQALLAEAQQPASPQPQALQGQQAWPAAQSIISKPAVSAKPTLKNSQMAAVKSINVTAEDMKVLGDVQHLQSFQNAKQAIKNNIQKILASSGTRESKSNLIKAFLSNPASEPTTRDAVVSCAMEAVQLAKSRVNTTTTPAR